jgi:hypothetical protein
MVLNFSRELWLQSKQQKIKTLVAIQNAIDRDTYIYIGRTSLLTFCPTTTFYSCYCYY